MLKKDAGLPATGLAVPSVFVTRSTNMATKIVVAGSTVSASQLKDFFRQVEDRSIDGNIMQAILEHRNPFAFERNEHGHVVLTLTGLDLMGVAEIERLEAGSYRVGNYAKSCFLSTREDSYDKHHRLAAGHIYKVALMPGKEIERDSDRTTANLRKRGMEHYGYGKPLGGFIPRVRETLSDKQMEELGIWYAVALHDPITDSGGNPGVLNAGRGDGGQWVHTCWGELAYQWLGIGAFVFLVSAS